jgi:hypothetical protein
MLGLASGTPPRAKPQMEDSAPNRSFLWQRDPQSELICWIAQSADLDAELEQLPVDLSVSIGKDLVTTAQSRMCQRRMLNIASRRHDFDRAWLCQAQLAWSRSHGSSCRARTAAGGAMDRERWTAGQLADAACPNARSPPASSERERRSGSACDGRGAQPTSAPNWARSIGDPRWQECTRQVGNGPAHRRPRRCPRASISPRDPCLSLCLLTVGPCEPFLCEPNCQAVLCANRNRAGRPRRVGNGPGIGDPRRLQPSRCSPPREHKVRRSGCRSALDRSSLGEQFKFIKETPINS